MVEPTTVRPLSSAALATAVAKSASVRNEPSLLLAKLDRALVTSLLLLSVHDATMEPAMTGGHVLFLFHYRNCFFLFSSSEMLAYV